MLVIGTREMFCVEHRKFHVWNTGIVLFGTNEMSCVEHTRCPAWNTRNVVLGTHGMSCLEHTECLAWNTGNHGGPAPMVGWAGGLGHVAPMFVHCTKAL